MKDRKTLYFILMFLPLLITAVSTGFLPDRIPAHYGFSGQADRWGSKYESFLFPVVTIGMGLFMLAMARIASRQEPNGHNNANVCMTAGIVLLTWFNVMNCYTLYTSFTQAENLSALSLDISQAECILLGILMVVLGNVMPKLKRNSVIGLRTPWSMENDDVWRKCQRFGGISFIITGILCVAAGFAVRGAGCLFWMLGILLTDTAICVYYSYRAAKKA